MKMRGAKQVHYDSGPNMTPLVDVVMVILIFLMLAGRFGKLEHYLASNVPIRQKGGVVSNAPVPDDVEFMVKVDTLSDHFRAQVEGIDTQFEDADKLKEAVTKKFNDFIALGKRPDQIQVLIDPGRTIKYNFLIQVYAAILEVKIGDGKDEKRLTKVAFLPSH